MYSWVGVAFESTGNLGVRNSGVPDFRQYRPQLTEFEFDDAESPNPATLQRRPSTKYLLFACRSLRMFALPAVTKNAPAYPTRALPPPIPPTYPAPALPPPIPPTYSATYPWFPPDALEDLRLDALRPLHALEQYRVQEESRAAEEGRQLDRSLGLRSPSLELPLEAEIRMFEERIEQERADGEFALQLAREEAQAGDSNIDNIFLPSPPQPVAGPSSLRLLSLSPGPPLNILPISSSALGRAPPPDVVDSTRSRKRLPAPSLEAKKRSTPFQIPKQLNDTWMSIHGPSTPTPTSMTTPTTTSAPAVPSSIFHVKHGGTRRAFANPQLVERFMLVFLMIANEGGAKFVAVRQATIRKHSFSEVVLSFA
ncbi:hypothetical protein FB451DRAFT_1198185 [Mycena latifolia]|nr:hypothetical protein FB451DRAFT_1198185 [Mycena latifolia]